MSTHLICVHPHYITHRGPIWTPYQPPKRPETSPKTPRFPLSLSKVSSMGSPHSKISYATSLSCQPIYSLSRHAISPLWDPSGPPTSPQNGQRQALKHHVFLTVLVRVWIMPPAHPPPSIQQIVYQFFQTIVLVDHQGIQGPATGTITFCLTYFMFPNII